MSRMKRVKKLSASCRGNEAEIAIYDALSIVTRLALELEKLVGDEVSEEEFAPFRTQASKTVVFLGDVLTQVSADDITQEEEEPVAEEPVAEEPVVEEPVAEETEEPSVEEEELEEFNPFDLEALNKLMQEGAEEVEEVAAPVIKAEAKPEATPELTATVGEPELAFPEEEKKVAPPVSNNLDTYNPWKIAAEAMAKANPVTEEPVAEPEPVVEDEPEVEQPVAEEPVVEEPVTEPEPAVEEPTAESVAEEQVEEEEELDMSDFPDVDVLIAELNPAKKEA